MKTANAIVMGLILVLSFTVLMSKSIATAAEDRSGQDASARKIFLIGNSLTWDTVPARLDESPQWHVDCGKSLKYIFEHPEKPCVGSSYLWPDALKNEKYDVLAVQPHYGTTIDEDMQVISVWIEMQPQATVIIHTGWAKSAVLLEEFADEDSAGVLTHSRVYFDELLSRLQQKYPQTEFRTTHAMRLLIELQKLIDSREAPLTGVEEIYRDAIHMTTSGGRYMMHNAMRETIGQPRTSDGFTGISPELKTVLDQLLDQRRTWNFSVPAEPADGVK